MGNDIMIQYILRCTVNHMSSNPLKCKKKFILFFKNKFQLVAFYCLCPEFSSSRLSPFIPKDIIHINNYIYRTFATRVRSGVVKILTR